MSLSSFVSPSKIALRLRADDWEEAIRLAGGLLIEEGICDETYVDDMVSIVRDLGPYIVVTPGVALAHARPSPGVVGNGVSVVTLDSPVEFGAPDNDPVHVIFAIAAISAEEHLTLFQSVAEFIEGEGNLERLVAARGTEDLPDDLRG